MDLLDLLTVIWVSLGVPIGLAVYGHIMGSKCKIHQLDKLIISVLAGALWPYILYKALKG